MSLLAQTELHSSQSSTWRALKTKSQIKWEKLMAAGGDTTDRINFADCMHKTLKCTTIRTLSSFTQATAHLIRMIV